MASDKEGSGFLSGFILGALAGAALVALLTPRPGDEMRAELRERATKLREQARDRMPEIRDRAEELASRAREQIPEVRDRAEELAALARERGQAAVEGLRNAAVRRRVPETGVTENDTVS